MEIVDSITEIVVPILDELGLEHVETLLRNESIGLVLRVLIYKEGGVNIDDCSAVSRELGYLLEVEDPINKAYSLEVSSPGLDRPLTTARDFERNKGSKITVIFDEMEEKHSVTGAIVQVAEGQLDLKTAKKVLTIPLKSIIKAKLVIEF